MTLAELISKNVSEIINANADGVEAELKASDEGKLSLSLPVKLTLTKDRVFVHVGMAYARKFTDELEDSMEHTDPKQPEFDEVRKTPRTK